MSRDIDPPARRIDAPSFLLPTSLACALAVSLLGACGNGGGSGASATTTTSGPSAAAASTASGAPSASPPSNEPDAGKRGAELVVKFECARCHDGLQRASTISVPEPPASEITQEYVRKQANRHCFHCHEDIMAGRYKAPKAAATDRWKKNVEHLRDVPTLTHAHLRFRRSWVESFLLKPHDLRPRLAPTMPRLALTPAQAKDIAAFLVPKEEEAAKPPAATPDVLAEGRELFDKKGCASCHVISGTAPFKSTAPVREGEKGLTPGMRLAPDLRHARDRMAYSTIVRWVQKPASIKPDTPMPETPLTDDEARKIASFIVEEKLAAPEPKRLPARLPVLERHVAYEEIKARVFNKICWHCHSDGDYAIGDDGPGNSGGFGYAPRGLNLASHEGILSGSLDDQGERRSIFEPMADGTPRLLAALLVRWREEAGEEDPAIRGMPMGMPGLSPEDVQLVETWIAQGHGPD